MMLRKNQMIVYTLLFTLMLPYLAGCNVNVGITPNDPPIPSPISIIPNHHRIRKQPDQERTFI